MRAVTWVYPRMHNGRRTLGRYQLGPRLGVGGMAEVYRAQARGADGFARDVALKVLLPDCRDDPELVEMFIEEARLCAELDHPNIISVFDFGEADGERFMAMELVDGLDLAALLRWSRAQGGALPLGAAALVGVELCRALGYAHQRGLVHRDVSPQNVFVTHAGAVKLADFGIARGGARRSRTARGQIRGKLGYLAPEQVRSEPLDGRADLYALALVLFELVTGAPYLEGETDAALLIAAADPPARAPSSVRAEASVFDAVLAEALQPHPLRRPRDAAALGRGLQAVAKQLGGLPGPEALAELVRRARVGKAEAAVAALTAKAWRICATCT
ncbi:MAG: serine/threonine protein kinase, partial [Myxococcales bacterium]|nr:serine/threonine protein kinase [Myxococcales bacterium]